VNSNQNELQQKEIREEIYFFYSKFNGGYLEGNAPKQLMPITLQKAL